MHASRHCFAFTQKLLEEVKRHNYMLLLLIAIVDRIELRTVIIGEELNGRSLYISDGLMNSLQR